jgi:small subunit ribosomal protein S6
MRPGEQQMRKYEVMFIVRPDIADEDMDKLVANVETNITNAGGQVTGTERMGKRRLAYTVGKFNDGNYVLIKMDGPGAAVKEIERRLRVTEQVIKFITVRIDEDEKRLDKIKKLRETKVRGKGTHAQAAAPVAEAPSAEAPTA